jgi:hypothetical protein
MEWSLSHFLSLSVLRQFQIGKPTRQQVEKNKQALKNKSAFACFMDEKHNQNLIYFIYDTQQRVKLGNND